MIRWGGDAAEYTGETTRGMGYETFRELRVWQEAKGLAVSVYQLADGDKLSRDFGLRDQMRRASVSVASNIAEGY